MLTLRRAFRGLFCALALLTLSGSAVADATHKQAKTLVPTYEGQKLQLNTFCLGPDGNLWMCCSDHAGAPNAGSIMIVQPTGEFVARHELEFIPQAINFSQDGKVAFVAGSGMIAKLDAEGKILKSIKAPNLVDDAEMKKKMEEAAKKQAEQIVASYDLQIERLEKQVTSLTEQVTKAEEKNEERALKRAKARLEVAKTQLESMQEMAKQLKDAYAQQGAGMNVMDRAKRATAVAVTKQDVFVTLPALEGYGYVLWRMNHDLGEATSIKDDLSGCCGQLDIQTDGEDILVAENTSFRVARYDRDGKELSHFGQRGAEKESGWGSCCNPMNIRCLGNDEVLTAESSIGSIKRYSKDGKYLGLIGTARIGGGCKHVALAVDTKRNWYFIMNQNSNNIAVLVPKDQAPEETEEEKQSREARMGLGKKLTGAWEYKPGKEGAKSALDAGGFSMEEYVTQQYSYLHFHNSGSLDTVKPVTAKTDDEKKSEGGLGGLLGNVIKAVSGSTDTVVMAHPKSNWEAIGQANDKLDFVILSEGVRGFGGTVSFVDNDTLAIQWYYDSPESKYGEPLTYKRVPGACCTDEAPCANCKH